MGRVAAHKGYPESEGIAAVLGDWISSVQYLQAFEALDELSANAYLEA